jgi:hypothetical protein
MATPRNSETPLKCGITLLFLFSGSCAAAGISAAGVSPFLYIIHIYLYIEAITTHSETARYGKIIAKPAYSGTRHGEMPAGAAE